MITTTADFRSVNDPEDEQFVDGSVLQTTSSLSPSILCKTSNIATTRRSLSEGMTSNDPSSPSRGVSHTSKIRELKLRNGANISKIRHLLNDDTSTENKSISADISEVRLETLQNTIRLLEHKLKLAEETNQTLQTCNQALEDANKLVRSQKKAVSEKYRETKRVAKSLETQLSARIGQQAKEKQMHEIEKSALSNQLEQAEQQRDLFQSAYTFLLEERQKEENQDNQGCCQCCRKQDDDDNTTAESHSTIEEAEEEGEEDEESERIERRIEPEESGYKSNENGKPEILRTADTVIEGKKSKRKGPKIETKHTEIGDEDGKPFDEALFRRLSSIQSFSEEFQGDEDSEDDIKIQGRAILVAKQRRRKSSWFRGMFSR